MGEYKSDRGHSFEEGEIMKAIILLSILIGISLSGVSNAALDWDITEGEHSILDGDEYGIVNAFNETTLDMTGGRVEYIFGYDNSIINFFGGDVDILEGHNHSTFALNGGLIDTISILDLSHFNIYGSDFVWQQAGGGAVSGWLSGNWLDGSSFNIYFRDLPEEFPGSHITLIPEPTSIAFLGLGFLVIRKGTAS